MSDESATISHPEIIINESVFLYNHLNLVMAAKDEPNPYSTTEAALVLRRSCWMMVFDVTSSVVEEVQRRVENPNEEIDRLHGMKAYLDQRQGHTTAQRKEIRTKNRTVSGSDAR